jgi:hypothetical protein
MLERVAERDHSTAFARCVLERSGYATKLFEFVPTEHTPKENNMLVGHALGQIRRRRDSLIRRINKVKEFMAIEAAAIGNAALGRRTYDPENPIRQPL